MTAPASTDPTKSQKSANDRPKRRTGFGAGTGSNPAEHALGRPRELLDVLGIVRE